MTKLLEKAFEAASKLPGNEQNAFARWLLEELEAERKYRYLRCSPVSPQRCGTTSAMLGTLSAIKY